MSEILKVTASYDKGNLNSGLADARNQLAQTAVAAAKLDSSLKTGAKGTAQSAAALQNLGRVAQDVPFGFIGIQNNLNPLLESFQRLKAETGSGKAALAALGQSLIGPAGLGIALSVVSSAIVIFQNGIMGFNKKAKEAKEATDELAKATESIFAQAAKEESQVLSLIAVLNSETETRQRKLSAIKELQQINPEVFNGLKLEGNLVAGLDTAYKNYIENLRTVIAVKIKQQQLETVTQKILEKEGVTLTKGVKGAVDFFKKLNDERQRQANIQGVYDVVVDRNNKAKYKQEQDLLALKNEQLLLIKDITELSNGVKLDPIKTKELKVKPEKIKIEKPALDTPFLLAQYKLQPEIEVAPKLKSVFSVERIRELIAQDAKNLARYRDDLRSIVESTLEGAFTGLGESIGQAIAGGGLEGIFKGLFTSLAGGLKELGKYLVQTYAAVAVIKKIKFSNPAVGIAVGVGLIALGAAIQATLNKKSAFATGVRGFDGGVALVGERGPERVLLPRGSSVIPAAQTAAMSKGDNLVVDYKVINGKDLAIILKRQEQYNGRNF